MNDIEAIKLIIILYKMDKEELVPHNLEDELVFNCASFAANYSGIGNNIVK